MRRGKQVMTGRPSPNRGTGSAACIASAELDHPVAVRGHRGQILGTVERIHYCLDTGKVALVDLVAGEEVIQLSRASIVFDGEAGCFQLRRRRPADASAR
jgi:hypothetical protein